MEKKTFAVKILVFLSIFAAAAGAVERVTGKNLYAVFRQSVANFEKQAGTIEILVTGDSRAERNINTGMFPVKGYNFSYGGEHIIASYYKTRHYLPEMKNLKLAVQTISYNNLMHFENARFFEYGKYIGASDMFRLFPFEMAAYNFLRSRVRMIEAGPDFCNFLIVKAKEVRTGKTPEKMWRVLDNGMEEVYNCPPEVTEESAAMNYEKFFPDDRPVMDDLSKKYLRKFVRMLTSRDIKVLIIQTPEHPLFVSRLPRKAKDEFNASVRKITDEYGAKYIVLSEIPIPDEFYCDFNHLNRKGADYFSGMLGKEIKKFLNEK